MEPAEGSTVNSGTLPGNGRFPAIGQPVTQRHRQESNTQTQLRVSNSIEFVQINI